jgi:hypothetical protein
MKFYTRISKTYRKDQWPTLLSVILTQNLACAKKLGLVDVSVECLLELLALSTSSQESIGLVTELHDLMTSDVAGMRRRSGLIKSPSLGVDLAFEESGVNSSSLTRNVGGVCVGVSMDEVVPIIKCGVQFERGDSVLGGDEKPVLYQVSLSCMNRFMVGARASVMRPCSVLVKFSDPGFNQCFTLGAGGDDGASIVLFESGDAVDGNTHVAFDNIYAVESCVFQGKVKGTQPMDLAIVSVSIVSESVKSGGNSFSMDFNIAERRESKRLRRVWYYREGGRVVRRFMEGVGELSMLKVKRRMPNVYVTLEHEGPAYIDEIYPVVVCVGNEEGEGVRAFLDVEVRSEGIEGEGLLFCVVILDLSTLVFGDLRNGTGDASKIVGLDLGVVEPGSTSRRTIYLKSKSFSGDRTLEYTVRFMYVSEDVKEDEWFKRSKEVIVPFTTAFSVESVVTPQNCCPFGEEEGDSTGLLSMGADFFAAPGREISIYTELVVVSTVKCIGPWDIEICGSVFVEFPKDAEVVAVVAPEQPSSIGSTVGLIM